MAVIGGAFSAAFQWRAFQTSGFQVVVAPNAGQNAGDAAYPQEIAYLERLRRIRKWQEERRRRYELRQKRLLDEQIDELLATRSGAEGERPDEELPLSQRAVLAKAKSAVQPLEPFRPTAATEPTPLGNQLRAASSIVLPAQERPETAYLNQRLAAYTSDQDSRRQTALQQLLILPTKPTRLTPDQLIAALAQGTREMQRLRGY